MSERIDAMGKQCPIPIVMAKKKIAEMKTGSVTVAVDNETAVENLKKMAQQKGYQSADRKVGENSYEVDLTFENAGAEDADGAEEICSISNEGGNEVVVISSDLMGTGDADLGKTLLKGFIYALASQDTLPKTMLFYNRGAFITTEGSDSLEDLKNLEEAGVTIMTCGTCLQHYGLSEKLKVGTVTNMYTITETMTRASKIIKP
ncbi:MAG: sulfurtransferase-like selenium metabolism protein YedF [Lachnospiraceae bacterium]|jgi:selenium metabolism protein YedF|nr:sulfurtransferase-like selenium metabolism protein YedF [Lachnospiraceae bacterium]